jgi:hypothetical protein
MRNVPIKRQLDATQRAVPEMYGFGFSYVLFELTMSAA